jgi:hypothetical protein
MSSVRSAVFPRFGTVVIFQDSAKMMIPTTVTAKRLGLEPDGVYVRESMLGKSYNALHTQNSASREATRVGLVRRLGHQARHLWNTLNPATLPPGSADTIFAQSQTLAAVPGQLYCDLAKNVNIALDKSLHVLDKSPKALKYQSEREKLLNSFAQVGVQKPGIYLTVPEHWETEGQWVILSPDRNNPKLGKRQIYDAPCQEKFIQLGQLAPLPIPVKSS